MATSIFEVQENVVSSDLGSYVIYLYGPPKSGKTTFAAQMPKPLVLATEMGYKAIPGIKAIDITSWADIRKVVRELKDPKAKEMFQTIIVDTLDLTSSLLEKYVLQQHGVTTMKEIEYGAGYSIMKKEFNNFISDVRNLGFALVFISHSKEKTIRPKFAVEYDQITQTCGTTLNEIAKNASDIIGYINMTQTGDRKLILRSSDGNVDAGCRFRDIEPEIEFSYDALSAALNTAIKKEAAENGNKFITTEKVKVKEEISYDFDALMNTFSSIVGELMGEKPEFYQPKIIAITTKVLGGKNKKVSELTPDQAELLAVIVDEIKALKTK